MRVLRTVFSFDTAVTHCIRLKICVVSIWLDSLVHLSAVFHVDVSPREGDKVPNLLLNTQKGFSFCDVIHSNTSIGVPYVTIRDGSKSLLSGCVPELQFDYLFVIDFNIFQLKVNPYCAILVVWKYALAKSDEQRCLARISVPNHDYLVKCCNLSGLNFLRLESNPGPYHLFTLLPRVNHIFVSLIKVRVVWAIRFFKFFELITPHVYGRIKKLRVRSSGLFGNIDIHGHIIDVVFHIELRIALFHLQIIIISRILVKINRR